MSERLTQLKGYINWGVVAVEGAVNAILLLSEGAERREGTVSEFGSNPGRGAMGSYSPVSGKPDVCSLGRKP